MLQGLQRRWMAKLRRWRLHRAYDQPGVEAAEHAKFREMGFDLDRALGTLDDCLASLGQASFTAQRGMASMHWVLFACVAQRFAVRRILELGTYDGQTTLLLSGLFPDASITSVDLPDDDPIFAHTYAREDPEFRRAFNERQTANTAAPGIELVKTNSLFLQELGLAPFDLIWVDGAHLYPEVAWDVCNCYQLCRPGGVMMVDDVMMDPQAVRMGYDGPTRMRCSSTSASG